jgi:amino acid efflux transporter
MAPVMPGTAYSSATARSSGLTTPRGAALTIGAVLGTGVISLPSLAADLAEPASIVAWVALVLLSIPLAATFAALGARHPDSGGVSTYVRRAFSGRAASAVGWCFYFAIPVGAPPAAAFAGGYVADLLGGGRTTMLLTAAALVAVVAAMNAFGLRISGTAQLVLAAVLGVLLVAATVTALPHADLDNLAPFAPKGWAAVGGTAAVLVWAFAGWEAVTSLSADYRNPRRDIPRVTVIAVVVVGVLYLGVVVTSFLVLGPRTGRSQAPLADLLAIGFGPPARVVTTVVALLLIVGAMNAYFAGGSRLGAALGRDGALPAWFARGGSAGEVPRRSLAVIALLSLTSLAVTAFARVELTASVLLATGSFTMVYVLGTAAAIKLLPRHSWAWRGAVVSFTSVMALLVLTGPHVLWAVGVMVTAVLYESWSSRRTSRATSRIPSSTDSDGTAPYPTTNPACVGRSPQ